MDRRYVKVVTLTAGTRAWTKTTGWVTVVRTTVGGKRVAVEYQWDVATAAVTPGAIVEYELGDEVLVEDAEEVSGG